MKNILKKFYYPKIKILMWSYGGEGKTTFLFNCIKNYNLPYLIPTVGLNFESIIYKNKEFLFCDFGGGYIVKELIEHYTNNDILMFFIDSSIIQKDLHEYNLKELNRCIKYFEEKPFLIVINKIDIRKKSTNKLIEMYQIERLFNKKGKFGIVECSSVTNEGVEKIKMWLDDASKEIIK